MAGLESIALAVAHLEQKGKHVLPLSAAADDSDGPVVTMPPRRTFDAQTPRVVSLDSNSIASGNHGELLVQTAYNPSGMSVPGAVVSPPTAETKVNGSEAPMLPPPPHLPITGVLDNDVLCGRGGETNHHPGNVKYRALVKQYQPLYIAAKRRDKPRIAIKIVHAVRSVGGRFLKKDSRNTWIDVGNVKAREKTSQALREGAPELRNSSMKDISKRPNGNGGEESIPPRQPIVTLESLNRGTLSTPPSWGTPEGLNSPLTPPSRRRRPSSLGDLAEAASLDAHYLGMERSTPKQRNLPSKGLVAIISGNDDESHTPTRTKDAAADSPRGPRIKLLKNRLRN